MCTKSGFKGKMETRFKLNYWFQSVINMEAIYFTLHSFVCPVCRCGLCSDNINDEINYFFSCLDKNIWNLVWYMTWLKHKFFLAIFFGVAIAVDSMESKWKITFCPKAIVVWMRIPFMGIYNTIKGIFKMWNIIIYQKILFRIASDRCQRHWHSLMIVNRW